MDGNNEEYTLKKFLEKLKKVLTDIYDGRNLLFNEKFRLSFEDAWQEILIDLNNLNSDVEDANENELKKVGLDEGGKQLKLKLVGLFDSYDEYDKKGGIWRLKDFLKYAKALLESLGDLIPGADLIKEIIEAIELGIDRAERGN